MNEAEWKAGTAPENEEERELMELAEKAYKCHSRMFENWSYGAPRKAWWYDENVICVEYSSGQWYHYRNPGTEDMLWF